MNDTIQVLTQKEIEEANELASKFRIVVNTEDDVYNVAELIRHVRTTFFDRRKNTPALERKLIQNPR